MDRPGKWKLSINSQIGLINVVLLFPAAWFWISVILYLSLGTDYFYDVIYDRLNRSFWGNLLVTAMVIGLPGVAVGINGVTYVKTKNNSTWWGISIGLIFLGFGFFAAFRQI